MKELFRDGCRKLEKAMDIIETVPVINDYYDPWIDRAYAELDDALCAWKGALEEMEETEKSWESEE